MKDFLLLEPISLPDVSDALTHRYQALSNYLDERKEQKESSLKPAMAKLAMAKPAMAKPAMAKPVRTKPVRPTY